MSDETDTTAPGETVEPTPPVVEPEPPAPEPEPEPEPTPPVQSDALDDFFAGIGIGELADDEQYMAMVMYLSSKESAKTPANVRADLVAWMHERGSTVEYTFPQ